MLSRKLAGVLPPDWIVHNASGDTQHPAAITAPTSN
jgi:hypothetical protein